MPITDYLTQDAAKGVVAAKTTAAPAPAAPGASAYPTGAPSALSTDPAYQAFLRASGLSQAVATADADRRRNEVNLALGIADEELSANGEQERRGISASQEDRGVFRSGQTLQRMSDQETGQARRKSAIELAASGQLGDIESGLLTNIANQHVRGAELGLNLMGNRTLEDGEAALAAAYAAPTYQAATTTTTRKRGY